MSFPARPIRKLLVANRGEIATRIINTAREYEPPIEVFTLACPSDTAHTVSLHTSRVLSLSEASDYLNIPLLISLVKKYGIDAVHPGYGFLSESAEFAQRMWEEAESMVVGPGWSILKKTGDKLAARRLAQACSVPVLPATTKPAQGLEEAQDFVNHFGQPIMIKEVDGGAGARYTSCTRTGRAW